MMNFDNYYIHATGGSFGKYNYKNTIIQILRDGKIKANASHNYERSPDNKICLCDPSKKIIYNCWGLSLISSFDEFVLYSPSLIFSKDLQVEVPEYLLDEQYDDIEKADCYDEVRYKGDLSLEHLKFITFPLFNFTEDKEAMREKLRIKQLKIFQQNIQVITKEFPNILMKDIVTGEDLNCAVIDKHIAKVKSKYFDFYNYFDPDL